MEKIGLDLVHDLVYYKIEVMRMSVIVNIHEAKTNFSRLLAQVGKGEEVIISKAGKPIARLIPFEEKPKRRVAGSGKGRIEVADDFDASLPESILNQFES
jgi:prevent-host-death family protein